MKLSNQPYKGTVDWFPEEYAVRKYIFDTWRDVCMRFGYLEYLTPLVEEAELYRAKSGGDVGGKELMTLTDAGGRELAIRPEMTPSVTRMVSRKYNELPKPIRLFSIANFMRGERPQRGRNREFWQLNADIFGSDSTQADVEILQMAIEIMRTFKAPTDSFVVYLNDRDLISDLITIYLGIPEDKKTEALRLIDKFEKLPEAEFQSQLRELGVSRDPEEVWRAFDRDEAALDVLFKTLGDTPGAKRIKEIGEMLYKIDPTIESQDLIKYNPGMVRGFDYYDGMVFEVFDRRHLYKQAADDGTSFRSLFGGGRYNGLGELFGNQSFPAVGFAPGDETTRLFLESWGLLDKFKSQNSKVKIFLPVLDESLMVSANKLAQKLRAEGMLVELGFSVQNIGKALDYANKAGIGKVIIFGTDEAAKGVYKVKDMESGAEEVREFRS